MIPPVEERSIRPCAYMYFGCCMHYDDYNESCRMGELALGERDHAILIHPVSKVPLNTEENQSMFDEVNRQAAKDYPCNYNISRTEFRALIDSGAADLRALVYIPPDLNDYDGTIRFKDAGKETEVVCMDDEVFYMLDPEYDHSKLDKEIGGAV